MIQGRKIRVNCKEHGHVRAYVSHQKDRGQVRRTCVVCKRMSYWLMYHHSPEYRERRKKYAQEWKKRNPRRVKEYRDTTHYRENQRIYSRHYREDHGDSINARKRRAYALKRYGVPTLPGRKGPGGRLSHGGKNEGPLPEAAV